VSFFWRTSASVSFLHVLTPQSLKPPARPVVHRQLDRLNSRTEQLQSCPQNLPKYPSFMAKGSGKGEGSPVLSIVGVLCSLGEFGFSVGITILLWQDLATNSLCLLEGYNIRNMSICNYAYAVSDLTMDFLECRPSEKNTLFLARCLVHPRIVLRRVTHAVYELLRQGFPYHWDYLRCWHEWVEGFVTTRSQFGP